MKRKSKLLLILSFVFIALLGLVISLTNRRMKVNTTEKKNFYDSFELYDRGNFESTIYFTSDSENYEISDDLITFYKNENPLSDNEIVVHFASIFDPETFFGTVSAGELVYKFSNTTLFSYYLNYSDYEIDVVNNMVNFYYDDSRTDIFGYIVLGSDIGYCSMIDYSENILENCTGNKDFYWDYNPDGLIFVNGSSITVTDSVYSFDLAATMAFKTDGPEMYLNELYDIYSFFNDMEYSHIFSTIVDESSSGEESNITLDDINLGTENVFTEWQSEWGTQRYIYDYYVLYPVTGNVDFDNYYYLGFYINDSYNVLSFSNNGISFDTGDVEDFNYSYVCDIEGNGYSEVSCYIVVGFDDDGSGDGEFTLDLNVGDQNKKFSWNTSFEDSGEDIPPEYPGGISNNFVQRNNDLSALDGAINKLNSGASVEFDFAIEATSSSITNGYKAFNLWNLTNNGSNNYTVSISSDSMEIDDNYSNVSNPSVLQSGDYNIVSFYPQDDVEYDYELVNNNYTLKVSSSDYISKEVYVSINNNTYELIGTYVKQDGNIVYYANDSRTIDTYNVSSINPVVLPEGVTKIKVSYTGNKAGVYLGINVNTILNGTDNVKSIISNLEDSVVLKNVGVVTVNGDNDYNRLGAYLTALEISSHVSSTSVVGERIDDGKTDVISYEDTFYEKIDYNEATSAAALEILNERKTATIYELLPIGAEYYGIVSVTTMGGASCIVNSNVSTNFLGTARDLLTIDVTSCPGTNINDLGYAYQSGFKVSFDVTYSHISNQNYGTTLVKDVMYEADGNLGNGYSDPMDASSAVLSDISLRSVFASLVNDGDNNLLFATTEAEVQGFSVSVGLYDKEVKNSLETSFNNSTNVVESLNYSYKLQYVFTSELERITDVVFVDKIESNYEENPYFQGYLDNIDISYLTSLGVDPIIYYAIGDINTEIFDATEWSVIKPIDATKIKAIAIDCGNYVFKGSDRVSPVVYINMIAPNGFTPDAKAYNSSKVFYKNVDTNDRKYLVSEVTDVGISKAQISIDGTSNFGTGTVDEPALIEGDLSYEIVVSNSDMVHGFDDIVVAVEVPDEFNVTNSNDGNSFTFNIDHINPDESIKFTFLLEFAEPPVDGDVYEAKYKIISLNGHDYNGEEKSIYNKVNLPDIEANKYVKTLDTSDFSDIAGTIIKKDEIFTYRVSVKNISDTISSGVKIVDTIPEGLEVIESSIGTGVLNGNTITWVENINASSTLNFDYKVKLSEGAVLGTSYRSNAHVQLINPLYSDDLLYDEDTNTISLLYQIASSVKITNTISGDLASTNKEFEYNIEFNGTSVNAGNYSVYGTDSENLTDLVLDETGHGTYTFKLKGNDTITFKNLTGGINYTIKQNKYDGYTSSISSGTLEEDYIIVVGNTNEEGTSVLDFVNNYNATGFAILNAKVTFDNEITDGMFKVDVDGTVQDVLASGSISSVVKNYNNEVGQYVYVIKQVDTGLSKISYDSTKYKVIVNVSDNKDGTLNTELKYYDNNDQEIEEIVFNNTYLPNGLTISNVNNSDYIDYDKKFTYELNFFGGEGTYSVKDSNSVSLENLVFNEGTANYSVDLGSNESIIIIDLPDSVDYEIKQLVPEYYQANASDEFEIIDNYVVVLGITENGKKEIKFNNLYETSASFVPSVNVTLEGKELEENEFTFKLLDVSLGITNGYTSLGKNDLEGNVTFEELKFTKPGSYKYEIVQLDNGSNHVYFDYAKVYLLLELTDNGDGTMVLSSSYEYENEEEHLVNKYSEEPIVKEEEKKEDVKPNPNTNDRVRNILILLIAVVILFVVERWVKRRRLRMNV